MPSLTIIGDSIAWGAWDVNDGGWVQRIRRDIDTFQTIAFQLWCPVYNLSVDGATFQSSFGRLEQEVLPRTKRTKDTGLVVALGVNDSLISLDALLPLSMALEEFSAYAGKFLSAALKTCARVVVVGLLPIDEEKVNPLPWDRSVAYTQERVDAFDRELDRLCLALSIPKLSFLNSWKERSYKIALLDGLHPNALGHRWMYESIKPFLQEHKLIDSRI
jgi:lysophospholipase L1-like esterase